MLKKLAIFGMVCEERNAHCPVMLNLCLSATLLRRSMRSRGWKKAVLDLRVFVDDTKQLPGKFCLVFIPSVGQLDKVNADWSNFWTEHT